MSGKKQRSTETPTAPTASTASTASNTSAAAPATGTGGKPLRVFRARGVSVAVFENHATIEGRAVTFLKAELRRVYRDGDQFRTTHALSANDIPVARLLLERAFEFMLDPGQGRNDTARPAEAGPDEPANGE